MPENITHVAVFGDSLTDSGELYFAFYDLAYQEAYAIIVEGLGPTPTTAELALADQLAQAFAAELPPAAQDEAYQAAFALLLAGLGPNPSAEELAAADALANIAAQQQTQAQFESQQLGPFFGATNEVTSAVYADELVPYEVVNYAVGGGTIIGPRWSFGQDAGFDSSFDGQFERYLDDRGGQAPNNSGAVLFLGGQDLTLGPGRAYADTGDLNVLQSEGDLKIAEMIEKLENDAQDLVDANFSTVFLVTQNPFFFYPKYDFATQAESDVAEGLILDYNAQIQQLSDDLNAGGIHTEVIDMYAVSVAITEDPTSIGIIDDRRAFIKPGNNTFDTDQVSFYDPVHPAEAIQQAWGAYIIHIVNGGESQLLTTGDDDYRDGGQGTAIFGLSGDDTLDGWRGSDIILGGTGNDSIEGDRGADILSGGQGNDILRGQIDDDILNGGQGDDEVFGNAGNDVLIDDLGADLNSGGNGDDIFVFYDAVLLGGTQTTDTIRGGDGNDSLYLVLDEAGYADFIGGDEAGVIASRGLDIRAVETIVAINGRDGVEAELGGFDWFTTADHVGLIAAPAPDFDL
jgi:phospholipase/lecithinase/hemolysin